ncbi:hypothetical protein FACS1894132_09240 [Clostridia bacterium]|nr:hypothetical protein FACS1894132_09240 [Clostridia bacterium]
MKKLFTQANISITNTQIEKLSKYSEFLLEYNKKINLTRITVPEDIIIKHFIDSVIILNYIDIPQNAKLADVGTGAGFPGVPLKIFRPDIDLTLVDSLNKRVVFLEQLLDLLSLDGKCVHARGEELSRKPEYNKKYDIVTARAVANITDLKKYCMGFLKESGKLIALKGVSEEINEGTIYSYNLTNGDGRRIIELSSTIQSL